MVGAMESGQAQKAVSLPQGLPVRAGTFFGRGVITEWLFFLCSAVFNRQSGVGVPGQTQHAWADAHSQPCRPLLALPREPLPPSGPYLPHLESSSVQVLGTWVQREKE